MAQTFAYQARNLTGKLLTGKIEAENHLAAVVLLREKNIFVTKINPVKKLDFTSMLGLKVKIKEMAIFCRQFATMYEAGISLLQCLNIFLQQTESKNLRKILQEVTVEIEKGKSLSEAFRKFKDRLPELFINTLTAGEISGTIDQALGRLAVHFEKEHALKEKIKSAMIYPLLVAGIAFLAMVVLLVLVVPIFVEIFTQAGATLPAPTRILIAVSSFLTKYWYIVLLALIVLFFALRQAIATENGKRIIDQLLLRLPVVGPLTHKTGLSRFARTLATLLRSGVPLMQSLETLEKVVGNTIVAKEISKARENIREGGKMAPMFMKSKIFPLLAVNMIAIGEESGSLDDLLEKLAIFYEQEVEALVTRLSSTIEPFLIAGVGLMVGFIALSIYLPLFSLAGALQGGMVTP
jgi:type IV pilus assembly protein PilC